MLTLNMISLNEYLKSEKTNNLFFEDALSNPNNLTLEEVYLEIFDQMIMMNEGILSALGKAFKKMGGKMEDAEAVAKEKMAKASDACKKAYEKAKEKAGKAWDKVKHVYASVITTIDEAIQNSKKAMDQMVANAGMKLEDFEATCAQVYANAIEKGTAAGKQIIEWVQNKSNGVQKIAAMNTFLIGAMMANKAGLDSGMALEILQSAGFK